MNFPWSDSNARHSFFWWLPVRCSALRSNHPAQSWIHWLPLQDDLHRITTGEEDASNRLTDMVNHQHPD
ncbi:MAG: hypothetical protein H7Y37_17970 [Anaerolineae bacterium]|nr:hypothetical protein [Gloeobacterales cyanobacterium ES-bin-313]